MIDQNIKNICHLIKQAFVRVRKPLSLNEAQIQELTIAFTILRRIDCLIGQYAEDCYLFYSENKDKISDKLLDQKLKELSGGYNFYNVSGYTFEGFLNSGLSVEVALNSYLQGFSSNVRYILSDMNFHQNVAIMLRQSHYIVDVFDFFAGFNLTFSAFSNKRFIDLITILSSYGFKYNGLTPTPIGLSKLICDILFCEDVCEGLFYDDPTVSVYDPVCGTGSLLTYAGEKAKALTGDEDVYLIGKDVSSFASAVASALVLLTGDKDSFVDDVNTLTDEDSYDWEFHFVVADLPQGLPWTPIRERIVKESQKENGRFRKGLPGTGDSQFLFIQDIVSKMDGISGRAAFISSAYVLQGGSVKSGEARIRMWLIESGLVETIIALPVGILPNNNTPLYLWILSCCDINFNRDNEFLEKMEGKVRLIDATKFVFSKNNFSIDNNFIDSVVKEYKSFENTSATKIVQKEELGFYEVGLLENGKKKETVTISLDTDIKAFVEEERKPYAKGKIAIDYSSVEKGYSVDFSKFFKSEETPIASIKDESFRMLSVMDTINSMKNDIESIVNRCTDTSVSDVWKEIPLRAATEIIQANNRSYVVDMRGLPIISMAYLRGDKVDEELYAVTHISKRVSSTDVILVRTGANAGEVFKGVDGILSPTLAAIRCTDDSLILPSYLYYLLKGYEKTLRAMTGGTSVKTLSTKSIRDFKCFIPSLEEQVKIAEFLDYIINKIDNTIKSIGSSNSVFSQYRQTIIENAVRGRIRLI